VTPLNFNNDFQRGGMWCSSGLKITTGAHCQLAVLSLFFKCLINSKNRTFKHSVSSKTFKILHKLNRKFRRMLHYLLYVHSRDIIVKGQTRPHGGYLGRGDQKDYSSRPAQPTCLQDSISINYWVCGTHVSSQWHGEAQIGGSLAQSKPRHNMRPYLKNNQCKKGWQNGSSGEASASQVLCSEFNSQYWQKKEILTILLWIFYT
jgi:hypothetical protein